MLDSLTIVQLYTNVLFNDMSQYGISDESVRIGIECMKEVYKPDNSKQSANRSTVADFNDVAHRCAYLHKYASLHTVMVRDIMHTAAQQNFRFFHELIFSEKCFKICSLGGGPGSDIIGVLAALHHIFNYFPVSVSVIDYMQNWCYSFHSILKELGTGVYGAFGNNTSHLLQWRYVGANLLKTLTPEVELELSNASLVTMVKFVSAASCKDTEFMVKNIFKAMKPGAVLFFIDNDGGGFRELILKAAKKCNFFSIFGPHQHENYTDEFVKVKRFGSVSCHKTTVSVHILQKPVQHEPYDSVSNSCYSPYAGFSERRVLLDGHNGNLIYNSSPARNFMALQQERYYTRAEALNYHFRQSPYSPSQSPYTPQQNHLTPYRSTPLTPAIYQPNFHPQRMHVNTADRIVSPETPRPSKRRNHQMGGCLPLSRLKHWRHHLSNKFNSFKFRVNSALQEKRKNSKSKSKSKG